MEAFHKHYAFRVIRPNLLNPNLNYVKASGYKLGIIVNFGESKLNYKRLVN